eukprot:scaffold24999_cov63-Phaeocystis_antarctica.AAC.8
MYAFTYPGTVLYPIPYGRLPDGLGDGISKEVWMTSTERAMRPRDAPWTRSWARGRGRRAHLAWRRFNRAT